MIQIRQKNTRNKAHYCVFLLLAILCIGLISAWEFDNVKNFDSENKVITIENTFGLGKTLLNAKQISNDVEYVLRGNDVKVFEMYVYQLDKSEKIGDIFGKIETYNSKDMSEISGRNPKYKVKVITGTREVIKYGTEQECVKNANNTECRQKIDSIDEEYVFEWKEIKSLEDLPDGEFTIGIFLDVKKGDRGEQIPTFFGVRAEEFSEWADISENAVSCWNFNEGTGTTTYQNLSLGSDLTVQEGMWRVGKEKYGIITNASATQDEDTGVNLNDILKNNDNGFAISFWINRTANFAGDSLSTTLGADWSAGDIEIQTISSNTMRISINDGGTVDFDPGTDFGLNEWQLVVININTTSCHWFNNGASQALQALTTYDGTSNSHNIFLWGRTNGASDHSGAVFDEVIFWNHTLSVDNVATLYNSGTGLFCGTPSIPPEQVPTVAQFSPIDFYNSSTNAVTFQGEANDTGLNFGITNISLFLNGIINHTEFNATGQTNMTLNQAINIPEGQHNWSIEGCDVSGNCTLSSNRTLTIDQTSPSINILYPTGNLKSGFVTSNVLNTSLNWTVSDSGVGLETCWYLNNSDLTNVTLTCGNNATFFNLPYGTYTHYVYANDTLGNEASDSETIIYSYNILQNSINYDGLAVEGSIVQFDLNITYNTTYYSNSQATLYYYNTAYIGTKTDGGESIFFTRNVTAPTLIASANVTFYWTLTLINDTYNNYNTSLYNQSVINLGADDCGTYGSLLLNLTLKDERDKTVINGTLYDSNVEVDMDIYPLGSSTPVIQYSQNYSQNNNPRICLQGDLINGSYNLNAQILYEAENYSSEYYHIQRYTIKNSTLPQNIDLYDLDDDNAQEFKIIYKDSSFLPVTDALIQIQRKYVSDGVSRTVEIPKTDSNGETTAHLELGDVIYTLIVVKDNSTLATFDEIIPVCQTPALTECRISLNSFKSSISPADFNSLEDFEFTLTYNSTSRLVKSIFSVPSSTVSTVVLNVTKYDQLGNTSVCDDSLTSASGTLSCTVPVSFGNGTIIAKLYKDNEIIGHAFFSMSQSPSDLYGVNVVFISLFLFLTLIGVGIGNDPKIIGFFLILGAIIAVALNIFDGTGFIGAGATVLWIIIAIILVIIKGARRE